MSEIRRSAEHGAPRVTYEMVEGIIKELGHIPKAAMLQEQLDDIGSGGNAAEYLPIFSAAKQTKEKLAAMRSHPVVEVGGYELEPTGKHKELRRETIEKISTVVRTVVAEGTFLGSGGTAVVHRDPAEPTRCYKIINNLENYSRVNLIQKEMELMEEVYDLEVEGVRSPRPHSYFVKGDLHVMVMDALPAVSLDQVIAGLQPLPKAYEHKTFFARLEHYLEALHGRGVYHRDVRVQNIMVDTVTGAPYVIDFGQSCKALPSEDPYYTLNDTTKVVETHIDDMVGLNAAKKEMMQFITNKQKV